MAIILTLLGWLISGVVRITILRVLLFFLVQVVVPILLSRIIYNGMSAAMDLVMSHASGSGLSPVIVSLGGLTGWLATCLKIPESFGVIYSAVMWKWTHDWIMKWAGGGIWGMGTWNSSSKTTTGNT